MVDSKLVGFAKIDNRARWYPTGCRWIETSVSCNMYVSRDEFSFVVWLLASDGRWFKFTNETSTGEKGHHSHESKWGFGEEKTAAYASSHNSEIPYFRQPVGLESARFRPPAMPLGLISFR